MKANFGRKGKRPTAGCDSVVFRTAGRELGVLLVKRGRPPHKGKWALPGGFLEWDESCETAAARELKEETGLSGVKLRLLGVFSEPGRDPRGAIISVAFWGVTAKASPAVKGGDDAEKAVWVPVKECPPLAFDHDAILKSALKAFKSAKRHG